jgi:hypothetical protein
MKAQESLHKLMLEIIDKINIEEKKETMKTNFKSDHGGLDFEGFKEVFTYDYPKRYPYNILKINSPIKNNITVEYLHVVPRRKMIIDKIEYKELVDLVKEIEKSAGRNDILSILEFLKQEGYVAKQPELSEDGVFIKFRFFKEEFTVKIDIKAIFINYDNWIPNAGTMS